MYQGNWEACEVDARVLCPAIESGFLLMIYEQKHFLSVLRGGKGPCVCAEVRVSLHKQPYAVVLFSHSPRLVKKADCKWKYDGWEILFAADLNL